METVNRTNDAIRSGAPGTRPESDPRLERIERVKKYEKLFDEALARPDPEKLRQLDAYYTSGQWRDDYEADERGELPPDLKRGVLSQDALYNLLSDREPRAVFREMLRKKQQLSVEECIEILKQEPRGVLSVLGDDDYPYGMPLNHFYCEEDGKLYFHSGPKGHKIDAISRHQKASFCVYDQGFRREGEWALNIRSVIVFGRIEIITDREKIYEISRSLSHKFTNDETYIEHEIRVSGPRTFMFALVPEHMTGKLVNEA